MELIFRHCYDAGRDVPPLATNLEEDGLSLLPDSFDPDRGLREAFLPMIHMNVYAFSSDDGWFTISCA